MLGWGWPLDPATAAAQQHMWAPYHHYQSPYHQLLPPTPNSLSPQHHWLCPCHHPQFSLPNTPSSAQELPPTNAGSPQRVAFSRCGWRATSPQRNEPSVVPGVDNTSETVAHVSHPSPHYYMMYTPYSHTPYSQYNHPPLVQYTPNALVVPSRPILKLGGDVTCVLPTTPTLTPPSYVGVPTTTILTPPPYVGMASAHQDVNHQDFLSTLPTTTTTAAAVTVAHSILNSSSLNLSLSEQVNCSSICSPNNGHPRIVATAALAPKLSQYAGCTGSQGAPSPRIDGTFMCDRRCFAGDNILVCAANDVDNNNVAAVQSSPAALPPQAVLSTSPSPLASSRAVTLAPYIPVSCVRSPQHMNIIPPVPVKNATHFSQLPPPPPPHLPAHPLPSSLNPQGLFLYGKVPSATVGGGMRGSVIDHV